MRAEPPDMLCVLMYELVLLIDPQTETSIYDHLDRATALYI